MANIYRVLMDAPSRYSTEYRKTIAGIIPYGKWRNVGGNYYGTLEAAKKVAITHACGSVVEYIGRIKTKPRAIVDVSDGRVIGYE